MKSMIRPSNGLDTETESCLVDLCDDEHSVCTLFSSCSTPNSVGKHANGGCWQNDRPNTFNSFLPEDEALCQSQALA